MQDALANADQVVEAIVLRGTDTHLKRALKKKELYEAAVSVSSALFFLTVRASFRCPLIYQDGACMVRIPSDGTVKSASQDGSFGIFGTPDVVRDALALTPGDTAWVARRSRIPEVSVLYDAVKHCLMERKLFPPSFYACRVAQQYSVVCDSNSLTSHRPLES